MRPSADAPRYDERVLVLAPTRKDGTLCTTILAEAGVACQVCIHIDAVCREIEAGAGACVLSEEALTEDGLARLIEVVKRQPAWSDFPLLLLTGEGADSELVIRTVETLGNLTLLEQPVRIPALVSAVRAALRARRRQYQIRAHLAETRRIADTLRAADRRKDEFLAILAHELRNPLAPLRNALEAMRLAPDPENAVWARDIMDRQVSQMVRLIDDLLDVSRVSRGKITLERNEIELSDIVAAALEACRPALDEARHFLTVCLPEEPVRLNGDRTRLVQVLCNLLSNAAKYTNPGGRIELRAERAGGEVIITVADSGVGIPGPMLEQIFDMFTQVEQTLERSQGGLGIGLTLVKRLVELHGGKVEARSAGPNCGSEFTIRLPSSARKAAIAAHSHPRLAIAAVASRHRILVADDNRDAADSLGNMLKLVGHDVRVAYDGAQAVALAEEFQPELALLDIGMPRLNGYEAARQIRTKACGAQAVLVALTGWGQPDDKRRSRAAGFDHHVVKPLDPAVLDRLLASRAAL